MELREFHNALRVMKNIDRDELVAAGVMPRADHNEWGEFRRNPYNWFLRKPDSICKKVWGIMERRMKDGTD